jgi:high-affinity iron transporter
VLVIVLFGGLALPVAEVGGQEVAAFSPATSGEASRAALFDAQSALAMGDVAGARGAVVAAGEAAAPLVAALRAAGDGRGAAAIETALVAAANAAERGDGVALAAAAGQFWPAVLGAAYQAAQRAVAAGQSDEAAAWLLLREFRPATRFARPGADATLAVRALGDGTVTADGASAAIEADLLDTYQGRLDQALAAADEAARQGFAARLAAATAEAAGYWAILAPSFETQRGPDARAEADAAFAALAATPLAGDTAAVTAALTSVAEILSGFRAAPLSLDEQARRAGQLLLYLSLVPVEYGRGVKGGQVTLEIEVQEARSFLDGAQAAFSDLQLALDAIDPAATAEVAATLARLDAAIEAAGRRQAVADPDQIRADAEAATAALETLYPEEWEQAGRAADFDVIATILDQMEAAAAAGQHDQAESARLEAYAIFDVGPEKRLLAFAPELSAEIEGLFWAGHGEHDGLAELIAGGASAARLRQTRLALDDALKRAELTLGAGQPADGAVVFNAAVIVFREGLEAVLILASLLAAMIGANRRYKRPLALGALAAFVASAALFFAAGEVLRSLTRYGERVEAIVSLLAVGVLLLVMNWFFHKVYWTRWIGKHHARRRRLLIGGAAGQALGLVALGFTSVFREGAETVLFLQALVLDAGTWVVLQGTLLGLAATAVVGILTFVLQTKLPHRKMLIVTGVMIAAVLVTMVGHTVHVFQVVGWLPIRPIVGWDLPYEAGIWLGLYATWQGVAAQSLALLFVIGSYFLAERVNERARRRWLAGADLGAMASPRAESPPLGA